MVNLKTFLSLAMPIQYCQMPQSKYKASFGMIVWEKKSLTLMSPISSTTVLYDWIDVEN